MDTCAVSFLVPGENPVKVALRKGATLLDAAREAGIALDSPCSGNGTCGKCRVTIGGQEVLACQTRPEGDVEVVVDAAALAWQNSIRTTDLSGEREKKFFDDNLTRLFDEGYLYDGDGTAATPDNLSSKSNAGLFLCPVTLPPPDADDAEADRERLRRVLTAQWGGGGAPELTLAALRKLPTVIRENNFSCNLVLQERDTCGGEIEARIIDILPPAQKTLFGLAVDIGTTTVSGLLVDLGARKPVASASAGNAQIGYGADVINRIIESTKPGGLERLRSNIIEDTLAPLVTRLCAAAEIDWEQIYRVSVAANTTMTHLFLGIPAANIRLEPYVPAFFGVPPLNAAEVGIHCHSDACLVIAPAVGSYVGGDISAGVFAARLHKAQEITLFIDLGTNGEIVIGDRNFMMSCACSAGPAFEGGDISCGMRAIRGAVQGCAIDAATLENTLDVIGGADTPVQGLCGSGLIAIIAELFRAGIIDAKGKFVKTGKRIKKDAYGMRGYTVAYKDQTEYGENIILWESDIDNFIRAKGALFSAIRTMLASLGLEIENIHRVIVAGGIGSGIDIEAAIRIGMFPKLPLDNYTYIGNSSLAGAFSALVSRDAEETIKKAVRGLTYLELSSHPSYMDEFVAACFLPHTDRCLFE